MNTGAVAKIAMLKSSMRCFVFGLLGFLPFIGVPFALAALVIGGKIRNREKQYWNAAKPYRVWGLIFGGVTSVLWTIIGGLILYNAVTGSWNND